MNYKTLFILGSQSKKDLKNETTCKILRDNDSFVLNGFYKIMEKYDFNPTYYGCFNYQCNIRHKDSLQKLVLENKNIRKFFLIGNKEQKQNFFDENVKTSENFQNIVFKEMDIYNFNMLSTNFEKFYNIGTSEVNAVQVGIMLGYTRIVLLGCSIDIDIDIDIHNYITTSWHNLYKYCPHHIDIINCSFDSNITFFDKNHISRINTSYNKEIEKCFHFLKRKNIKTFYFNYNDIYDVLQIWETEVNKYFKMRIKNQNIQVNDFFTTIKNNLVSIDTENYLNNEMTNYHTDKIMSIILIIKNKPFRTRIYLEYLNKIKNFNKYAQLIIVEDKSDNNIDIEQLTIELNLQIDIKHYLINSNTRWNRSLLINYGLQQNPYKLSLISDVDFIFDPNYFDYFIENFNHFDFDKYHLAFPCVETNTVHKTNNGTVLRNEHTCYGHYYIFNTQKLINIGGYDHNIVGHGFEERELLLRLLYNNINILFFNTNSCKHLFGLHLSHSDTLRGGKRSGISRSEIILNLIKNPHF